jgi:hypothetical protein
MQSIFLAIHLPSKQERPRTHPCVLVCTSLSSTSVQYSQPQREALLFVPFFLGTLCR